MACSNRPSRLNRAQEIKTRAKPRKTRTEDETMAEMISVFAFQVQRPFEAPFVALTQWKKARATRRMLNELSSDRLFDIGLNRADIASILKG